MATRKRFRFLFPLLPLLHLAWQPCFFDFFAKEPTSSIKGASVTTGSYSHLKLLKRLRRAAATDKAWKSFCKENGYKSTLDMPEDVLEKFVLDPLHHSEDFLSEFAHGAGLPKVTNDFEDDEMELGGFMDSNLYGLIKSDKERQEEQRKRVAQVKSFISDPKHADMWRRFCLEAPDPDDEESRAVRAEMAARSDLGRQKTALESWLDAETGKAPPSSGNKWGL